MIANEEDAGAEGDAVLSPRIALLSIVGFWLFYLAIVTVRSVVLELGDLADGLARRGVVVVVSGAATLLLYLVLRRLPRRSLGLSIAVAATLAVPAAILYSTINWIAFRTVVVQPMPAGKKTTTRVIVVEGPDRPPPAQPPPPPPPPPSPSSSVSVPVSPPPPPEKPTGLNRRITVQVGSVDEEMHLTPVQQIADNAANGYFFIVAWAALYLALCYAAEVRVAERRTARFRAAAQAAEIRALRYQVNPHFLFNTLNSLSSLVMTGKAAEAERMILNLATFFRTSLTGDPTEDMRLEDEIRLQRLYLDIEAVRFPERLRVEVAVPEPLMGACVPGMILQPLVENAIKYGVSRAGRPVTVRIAAREEAGGLVLVVADDGDPADASCPKIDPERWDAFAAEPVPAGLSVDGTGVGLRNVRDRLAARFGGAARARWGAVRGGGFAVMLFMPLLHHDC